MGDSGSFFSEISVIELSFDVANIGGKNSFWPPLENPVLIGTSQRHHKYWASNTCTTIKLIPKTTNILKPHNSLLPEMEVTPKYQPLKSPSNTPKFNASELQQFLSTPHWSLWCHLQVPCRTRFQGDSFLPPTLRLRENKTRNQMKPAFGKLPVEHLWDHGKKEPVKGG